MISPRKLSTAKIRYFEKSDRINKSSGVFWGINSNDSFFVQLLRRRQESRSQLPLITTYSRVRPTHEDSRQSLYSSLLHNRVTHRWHNYSIEPNPLHCIFFIFQFSRSFKVNDDLLRNWLPLVVIWFLKISILISLKISLTWIVVKARFQGQIIKPTSSRLTEEYLGCAFKTLGLVEELSSYTPMWSHKTFFWLTTSLKPSPTVAKNLQCLLIVLVRYHTTIIQFTHILHRRRDHPRARTQEHQLISLPRRQTK